MAETNTKGQQIKNLLTPGEIVVIQLALQMVIDDMTEFLKLKNVSSEGKRAAAASMKDASTALAKISVMSGTLVKMNPYKEGDEKDFLNPQNKD